MPARSEFDEDNYLLLHPDVSDAIAAGIVGSAWQHFTLHGFAEGRAWTGKPDPLVGVNLEIATSEIEQLVREYRRTGFGYVDYRDEPGYGISVARPAFVIDEFAQHPEWQLIGYRENGWDYRQDVIALQKLSERSALRVTAP